MVRGYPGRPAVFAGETLWLHAAAIERSTAFRACFFRWGDGWEFRGESAHWRAPVLPEGCSTRSWDWPANPFSVPRDWPSGPYLALFVAVGEAVPDPDDPSYRHSAALFVVKRPLSSSPASILYKLPLFTYCAYNGEGGGSLYTGPRDRVTLHRPGGGAGGDPCDMGTPDAYDLSSPRQTFAHWDAPFLHWLERNGYALDCCTDLDLHEGSCRLEAYRVLVSVGHDEYWSQPMRSRVEKFVAGGGNVAFFGGNTCWWRVHLTDDGSTIECNKHKCPGETEAFDQWMRIDPETRLTGVSFRYGGGWWSGTRDPVGYTVQHAGHWVYAGTGLHDGDTFGDGPEQALIGYECDGAGPLEQTPESFQVLGLGKLTPHWEYREMAEGAAATMGIRQDAGVVFTASTTDWARVLAAGDPVVDRITRNVLNRLSDEEGRRRIAADCRD